MLRASLRGIWDHKFRTILLGLAVVAGVSFVSASFIFTDTISSAFDGLFASSAEGLDVNVTAVVPEEGFGFQQFRMDETVADQIESIDGVEEVFRSVTGIVTIVVDGNVITSAGPPQFGVTWAGDVGGFSISEGRPPETDNEVVVDVGLITRPLVDNGSGNPLEFETLELGDTIEVAGTGAVADYEIVGVASFGEEGGSLGATFIFFEFSHGQEKLVAVGELDSIDLTIDPGLDVDIFVDELNAVLPDDVEARSSQAAAEAQAAQLQQGLSFISTFLLVFAGISVFVGVFVVYNAFRTVIGQRSRELALFRVLGSTRQQVLRSVLAEAFIIGIAASITGVFGGIVLAFLLEAILEIGGGNLPDGPLQVVPRTVVAAVSVGILTTIISALIPAYRASRISPMAALAEVEKPTRGFDRRRLASLLLFAGGIVLSVVSVLQSYPNQVLAIGLVAFVIGAYLIGAFLAQPVIRVFTKPIQSRVTGDLARQNAQRSPRRTASTAGALMVGVALVTAVAILTVSIQETARAAIEEAFSADFVIQQAGFNALNGISEEIAPIVAGVEGVDQLTAIKGGQAQVDGNLTFVAGVDPTTFVGLISYEDIEGDFADLVGNTVAVQRSKAEDEGLTLGSSVDVAFAGDAEPFEVVAIWDLSGETDDDTSFYIPRSTYAELSPAAPDLQVTVKIVEGAELETVKADIEEAIVDYPTASVSSQADILVQIEEQLNGFLILIFGLLGMSVLIALLGVLLTLLLSVFERTREIGLLRAVGMIRSQVRSMVRWESVIVALFGALLGVGVGLFLGWILGRVIFDDGAVYTIPWTYVAAGFVSAAIAGLLAAWWPARRAASLNILEAIAYE